MSKKTIKKVHPSKAEMLAIEKLRKAQERRDEKYKDCYVIYGYRVDGKFTPNMIVLPKASEQGNPYFVRENILRACKERKFSLPSKFVLVRLGEFSLASGKIDVLSQKIVFDFENIRSIVEDYKVKCNSKLVNKDSKKDTK